MEAASLFLIPNRVVAYSPFRRDRHGFQQSPQYCIFPDKLIRRQATVNSIGLMEKILPPESSSLLAVGTLSHQDPCRRKRGNQHPGDNCFLFDIQIDFMRMRTAGIHKDK